MSADIQREMETGIDIDGIGSREDPYMLPGSVMSLKQIAELEGARLRAGHTIFMTLGKCTFSVYKNFHEELKWLPGSVRVDLVRANTSKFNCDEIKQVADQVRDIVNIFHPILQEVAE